MRCLPLFALLACSNPLSNELFYADAEFLDALPGSDRVGFSSVFAGYPRNATDPLLQAMATDAEEIDPVLSLIGGVGDLFRQTTPTERSETHRRWDARAVSAPLDGGLWVLQADIARIEEGAELNWQIQAAATEDGPFEIIGSGRHSPIGDGTVEWDLAATTRILGLPEVGPMTATYVGGDQRDFEFEIRTSALRTRQGRLTGTQLYSWVGEVAIDEARHIGAAQTFLEESGAGRTFAIVFEGEVEQIQESCWNTVGSTQWATGSMLTASGAESACTTPDVFDQAP